jgi:uncharacterized protein YjbI with pentapeptide repeats
LRGAKLQNADLNGVYLDNADLSDARLTGFDVNGNNLEKGQAQLDQACGKDAKLPDPRLTLKPCPSAAIVSFPRRE